MITNVSLATVWVNDQDEAKAFYVDTLGFREGSDVAMGDGYRWVTVIHPDHPELQLTLMRPGPPLDDEQWGPGPICRENEKVRSTAVHWIALGAMYVLTTRCVLCAA